MPEPAPVPEPVPVPEKSPGVADRVRAHLTEQVQKERKEAEERNLHLAPEKPVGEPRPARLARESRAPRGNGG
ncbi:MULTISPECIES: hypothetical protein [unclassified Streptomyces]|uniref:hypothetical protein n=1 Tax=unclassified Streptomyces TaxID=2593676 RepID=UPI0006AFEB9F|nr:MULTISPECIES: hypothetical protein [unclassified Streptomyces]KOX25711.1 hypothetical protein ADL06_18005 [Streptomyces sp. NRRL F-6491]KOX49214.1 hypothetical protein ADL08_09040 [Streptomyces sp. NRRL F-6492]